MAIRKLPSTGDAPRSTGVPESLKPGGSADSAGFPWAGRTFDHHGTAFADDDGSTPEAHRQAVRRIREAAEAMRNAQRGGTVEELQAAEREVAHAQGDAIRTLSGLRVLVPMLAEAGDFGLTPEGRTVEKSQELSIVTVRAPDGRQTLPVFTSVDTMRTWNPESRPIPVPATQAAVAAAQENTELIIVDPGTPELELAVRRTALEPLALGEQADRWLPAWADASVAQAFREIAANDPIARATIHAVMLAPGDPDARLKSQETDVLVGLPDGLDREELSRLLTRIQELWIAEPLISERVDSLRIVPRAMPDAPA